MKHIDSYMILIELYGRVSDYKYDPEPQYDDLMHTLKAEGLLDELAKITAQCVAVHSRAVEDRVQKTTLTEETEYGIAERTA